MKKFFIAMLSGFLLVNMSAANAATATPAVNSFGELQIEFSGYATLAQRRLILQGKINNYQLQLKENPSDQKIKHELAEAWNELGSVYFLEEEYQNALNAFNEALTLEPNNAKFRKNRDAAQTKLKSGGGKKDVPPKFNGLG